MFHFGLGLHFACSFAAILVWNSSISLLLLQFQVRASDQRDPPRVSDTQVVIQVVRDNRPRFVGTPYFASASETNAVDTVIFDVNAIDDNLRVGVLCWH